ncbi:hypothetical protein O163_10085 [Caldanaerobacter subterraneus subsp. yonseiensis KB-1]|uniref:Uncharacterized protein n=1 Tax=Caldanaerobacter subterraneus subsp. yonseiensis KB-1 TaxID=1388761 RepID=U5CNE0_CALSX|nr:hypothetical protein [Caldanaerobacter subterraneus]ERM91513.1 hypothetical protein O163_10085 [Caldanaerobacter subterraneus subsp. yonseiensis KB-1]
MRRNNLFDNLMFVITILSFPFLFVYVAGKELFKKAVYIAAGFFGTLLGILLLTTSFIALFGDSKEALKQMTDFVVNMKGFIFIELPQDIPVWTNKFINYLHMNPFARNLLIMWLIGFLIQTFFNLLGRYGQSFYVRRARNINANRQQSDVPPQEPDPTGGFTKAHFDVYFPEGWQERRQSFFNQVREAKEAIQKRIKDRGDKKDG